MTEFQENGDMGEELFKKKKQMEILEIKEFKRQDNNWPGWFILFVQGLVLQVLKQAWLWILGAQIQTWRQKELCSMYGRKLKALLIKL